MPEISVKATANTFAHRFKKTLQRLLWQIFLPEILKCKLSSFISVSTLTLNFEANFHSIRIIICLQSLAIIMRELQQAYVQQTKN